SDKGIDRSRRSRRWYSTSMALKTLCWTLPENFVYHGDFTYPVFIEWMDRTAGMSDTSISLGLVRTTGPWKGLIIAHCNSESAPHGTCPTRGKHIPYDSWSRWT